MVKCSLNEGTQKLEVWHVDPYEGAMKTLPLKALNLIQLESPCHQFLLNSLPTSSNARRARSSPATEKQ